MDNSPERIPELPGKQQAFVVDQRISKGGAIGFRVLNDCTISMQLLFDAAPGVAIPFVAGETFVGRIIMIASDNGATVTNTDIVLYR